MNTQPESRLLLRLALRLVEQYRRSLQTPTAAVSVFRSTIHAVNIAARLMVHKFARGLRNLPTDADLPFDLLASECSIAE